MSGCIHVASAAVALNVAVIARADVRTFTMSADGVCGGTGSQATATGSFTLDTVSGVVDYQISITGLTPQQMHIHGPADTCATGRVAPVLEPLPVGTQVSDSFNLSSIEQQLMLEARLWFNAHTALWPAGEITGRIVPDCINDCSGHGTCDLGVCTCNPGWKGPDCATVSPIPTISGAGLVALGVAVVVAAGARLRRREPKAAY